MEQYLLGIDIGTSACKIGIFQADGTVMGMESQTYPVYYPHTGWAEQDPREWWKAVCQGVRRLLEKTEIPAKSIVGIGVDGQSWSAIPIDKDGNVLCNTPIWMDTRADEICKEVRQHIGEDLLFQVSGNPFMPSYTTPKVLWYQKYRPELYQKIDKILQSNSYIVFCLTGVVSQELSQGYGWHCFDMRKGEWNQELCREMGISDRILPEIFPCHGIVGRVTREAAIESGLAEGTPVVAGALDAACGTLGAGVIEPGQTQEQGGQAGGMSIYLEEYHADPRLILSYHANSKGWLLQGGTVGGGGVMRWMEQEFGQLEREESRRKNTSSFELLGELAKQVPEGSEGLIFLPYMAGERSPIWNPKAKGVYYGIDFTKTKGHFLRSGMEGVAYALRHNLEVAEQAGVKVTELRAMGGSANSLLWTQIKADITGKMIKVPASDTATTLGAVILAGVGVGIYPSFEAAVKETVECKRIQNPNLETRDIYQKGYEEYLELYENLKDLMNRR